MECRKVKKWKMCLLGTVHETLRGGAVAKDLGKTQNYLFGRYTADMDLFPNGFALGFGFPFRLGLDWILDLKNCSDLDLDLDFISQMDSNPSPRIQIRTALASTIIGILVSRCGYYSDASTIQLRILFGSVR